MLVSTMLLRRPAAVCAIGSRLLLPSVNSARLAIGRIRVQRGAPRVPWSQSFFSSSPSSSSSSSNNIDGNRKDSPSSTSSSSSVESGGSRNHDPDAGPDDGVFTGMGKDPHRLVPLPQEEGQMHPVEEYAFVSRERIPFTAVPLYRLLATREDPAARWRDTVSTRWKLFGMELLSHLGVTIGAATAMSVVMSFYSSRAEHLLLMLESSPMELSLHSTLLAMSAWLTIHYAMPRMSMPLRFSMDLTTLYRGLEGHPEWILRIRRMPHLTRAALVAAAVLGVLYAVTIVMETTQLAWMGASAEEDSRLVGLAMCGDTSLGNPYIGFVGPVLEECVFRGILFARLLVVGVPMPVATAVSTVLFTAAHWNATDPTKLINVSLGGMLMCAGYYISGSLWTPIAIHVVNNVMQAAQYDNFRANYSNALIIPGRLSRELDVPDNATYRFALKDRKESFLNGIRTFDVFAWPMRMLWALVPASLFPAKAACIVSEEELHAHVREQLARLDTDTLSESQFWALYGPEHNVRVLLEAGREQAMTEVAMRHARYVVHGKHSLAAGQEGDALGTYDFIMAVEKAADEKGVPHQERWTRDMLSLRAYSRNSDIDAWLPQLLRRQVGGTREAEEDISLAVAQANVMAVDFVIKYEQDLRDAYFAYHFPQGCGSESLVRYFQKTYAASRDNLRDTLSKAEAATK